MNSEARDPVRVLAVLLCACIVTHFAPACRQQRNSYLEVEVRGVGIDPESDSPVMFLQDKESGRGLPVWIGTNEARAIHMQLEHVDTPRPLTHDLMKNMLEQLNATVEKAIIEDLRETTYYATLTVRAGSRRLVIDSRPSDAVALALKCNAPVYISERLIKKGLLIDIERPELKRSVEETYGISFQDITASVARYFELEHAKGVIISAVEPGGAGERAGFEVGDVIVGVDGNDVEESETFETLVFPREDVDSFPVEVLRRGKRITCQLSAGAGSRQSEHGGK